MVITPAFALSRISFCNRGKFCIRNSSSVYEASSTCNNLALACVDFPSVFLIWKQTSTHGAVHRQQTTKLSALRAFMLGGFSERPLFFFQQHLFLRSLGMGFLRRLNWGFTMSSSLTACTLSTAHLVCRFYCQFQPEESSPILNVWQGRQGKQG